MVQTGVPVAVPMVVLPPSWRGVEPAPVMPDCALHRLCVWSAFVLCCLVVMSRADGRLPVQLRPLAFHWDPASFALSALTVHAGRTRVLCSVSLEEQVPGWRRGSGSGWLSAEYRLLPASTPTRQPRELLKLSGRTQEIQRLIGRSLRACLDLTLLGERTLLVDCDVLQADAGTRTAAITGAWVALAASLEMLQRSGRLGRSPLRQQVGAISVGVVMGELLLDLDYSEDSRAEVDLNVVMDDHGQLLEIQGTAEGQPFSRLQLEGLLDLACGGITQLQAAQREALLQAPFLVPSAE
jgi:ribonuclease PH